jgi:D-galactarolactone isomerase
MNHEGSCVVTAQPKLAAPPGLCDTHMHVYGPPEKYPEAPTSKMPPPFGPLAEYRKLMKRLGIERVVVVQPSSYGFDNSCTMDAVAELGPQGRAVVVVGSDERDVDLARLTGQGARGVRFHMFPGGVLSFNELEATAARVHEHGWHVQLQMDGRQLHEQAEMLARLPCGLVIDHTGKFLEPVGLDHPGFRALLRLVESGRVWVKLSAPYETSKSGPPHFADVGALARALAKAAPDRMLWASNWPHPSVKTKPDDAMLLDVLAEWLDGDEAAIRKALVDNPAELYGFGG